MPVEKPTIMNMSLDSVATLVGKIGMPTLFTLFVMYLIGWQFGPPVLEAYTNAVEESTKTQEVMRDSLKTMTYSMEKIAKTVDEIQKIETTSQAFMESVHDEHAKAQTSINGIGETVNETYKLLKDRKLN